MSNLLMFSSDNWDSDALGFVKLVTHDVITQEVVVASVNEMLGADNTSVPEVFTDPEEIQEVLDSHEMNVYCAVDFNYLLVYPIANSLMENPTMVGVVIA